MFVVGRSCSIFGNGSLVGKLGGMLGSSGRLCNIFEEMVKSIGLRA